MTPKTAHIDSFISTGVLAEVLVMTCGSHVYNSMPPLDLRCWLWLGSGAHFHHHRRSGLGSGHDQVFRRDANCAAAG